MYLLWNQSSGHEKMKQTKSGKDVSVNAGGKDFSTVFYHYSQLGDYRCPKCGFKRPTPDFDAEDVKVGDQLFSVEEQTYCSEL